MSKRFEELQREPTSPGQVVRAWRNRLHLSLRELAEITGIANSNLSQIERDKMELGVKRATLLAAAFGISPAVLLFPNGYQSAFKTEVAEVRQRAARVIREKSVNASLEDTITPKKGRSGSA